MFDPSAHGFYDPSAVEKELRRVADICHGCRRCYDLCPSFDVLFQALDRPEVDGEAERLRAGDLAEFSDLCYECKLCIPHCPYYPPHRWEVDIPRVVLRDRASRVKHAGGAALRERILASVDAVGKLSSAAAPLVNSLNDSRLARVALEKTLGVHRDRLLPTFAGETFLEWWQRRGGATAPSERAPVRDRVALFVTCSFNYNTPEVGRAAVAVLENLLLELRDHAEVESEVHRRLRAFPLDADRLAEVIEPLDALGQALRAPRLARGFARAAGDKGDAVGVLEEQRLEVTFTGCHGMTFLNSTWFPAKQGRRPKV